MESDSFPEIEIKVQGFKWVQKLLLAGHYVFEIKIIELKSGKERIIERRFSEIEWLNKNLIKFNPGSRIPFLPEKNVWCKLNVNNERELENRKEKIQVYLNYINNHKFLSKNSYFQNFLSDNFKIAECEIADNVENKNQNKEKGFFGGGKAIFKTITSYMPTKIPFVGIGNGPYEKGNQNEKSSPFRNTKINYEDEKENFIRMKKGIEDLGKNIKENNDLNEIKIKALGEFIENAKELKYLNFDYHKQNLNASEGEVVNEESKIINKIEQFQNKKKDLQNKIENELLVKLNNFKIEIDETLQIFERKKKLEIHYFENNITEDEPFIKKFEEEFQYELDLFKNKKQGGIVEIFEEFYKLKLETDVQIEQIFSSKF